MQEHITAFIDSAMEVFRLPGPIYHVGPQEKVHDDYGASSRKQPTLADELSVELPETNDSAGPFSRNGHEIDQLPLTDDSTAAVLCTGTWPYHSGGSNPHAQGIAHEIRRVLAPGGAMLLCTQGGETDVESAGNETSARRSRARWRPTPHSLHRLLAGMGATLVVWENTSATSSVLYGVGFKPPVPATALAGIDRFAECLQARLLAHSVRIGPLRRFCRKLLREKWLRLWQDNKPVHSVLHFSTGFCAPPSPAHANTPSNDVGGRIDLIE